MSALSQSRGQAFAKGGSRNCSVSFVEDVRLPTTSEPQALDHISPTFSEDESPANYKINLDLDKIADLQSWKKKSEEKTQSPRRPLKVCPTLYSIPQIYGIDEYNYEFGKRCASRAEERFTAEVGLRRAKSKGRGFATFGRVAAKKYAGIRRSGSAPIIRNKTSQLLTGGAHHANIWQDENANTDYYAVEALAHWSSAKVPRLGLWGCSDSPRDGCEFREAQGSRSAVILWNTDAPPSDTNTLLLHNRRTKLTDDLFKEIVVSYADHPDEVKWCFKVFEAYCDPPPEVVLPTVPEVRKSREDDGGAGAIDPLTQRLHEFEAQYKEKALLHQMQEDDSCWQELIAQGGEAEASKGDVPKCQRLSLRQGKNSFFEEVVRKPKPKFDGEIWAQTKKELKHTQSKVSSQGGDGKLIGRCSTECLDKEKLAGWWEQQDARTGRRTAVKGAVKMTASALASALTRSDSIQSSNERSLCANRGSTSQDSEDSCESATSACFSGDEQERLTTTEVMLHCASVALSRSHWLQGSVRKVKDGGDRSRSEVMRERARILKAVVPNEMSPVNLFEVLTFFGVAKRKLVDRMCNFLIRGVSSRVDIPGTGHGLTFERFFRLIQDVLAASPGGHLPKSTVGGTVGKEDSIVDRSSEMLKRLLYSVLADQADLPSPSDPTKLAQTVKFSVDKLLESLRLFLHPKMLVDMDYAPSRHTSSGTGRQREDSSISHSSGCTASALRGFAQFLHAELVGGGAFPADDLRDSRDGAPRSPTKQGRRTGDESTSRFVESHTSSKGFSIGLDEEQASEALLADVPDNAFDRFRERWPAGMDLLFQLLLPLMAHGRELLHEDMHLKEKSLLHRSGELHARITAHVLTHQRRVLSQIYLEMTKPMFDARQARKMASTLRMQDARKKARAFNPDSNGSRAASRLQNATVRLLDVRLLGAGGA